MTAEQIYDGDTRPILCKKRHECEACRDYRYPMVGEAEGNCEGRDSVKFCHESDDKSAGCGSHYWFIQHDKHGRPKYTGLCKCWRDCGECRAGA